MTRHRIRCSLWALALCLATPLAVVSGLGGCTNGDNGNDNETKPPGNDGLTGKFLGAQECSICHQNLHTSWAETRHAKAFETIEALGEDDNEVCLGCHSTGFRQEGGFANRATTDALANVGCEACHGAGKDHRTNVAEEALRPSKSMSSAVCAQCHNGYHHDTYDEWNGSLHAVVNEAPANYFTQGQNLNNCGTCHSGDFRQAKFIDGMETVSDALLAGKTAEEMNGVTCSVCHDPHERTGNGFQPKPGFDFQLRYPEVVHPIPSNSIADATNPDRFNGCGQCHHSRDRTWQSTTRGPHDSIQANFYTGEMPVPDGTEPLLPNERTVHAFVPGQCTTCHMQHHEFVEGEPGQTHAGHQFAIVSTAGCSTSGCHPSPEVAAADLDRLQGEIQTTLDGIAARLGDPTTWEYSGYGGPPEDQQAALSDEIKKIRFLYHYVLADGSLGVHNPEYARAILAEADDLITSIGR